MSKLYLAVPFEQKDRAKYAGASWDANRRAWYIENARDITGVRQWLPMLDTKATLRSSSFQLVHGVERCWQCAKLTLVTAFLLPAGYEVLHAGGWSHGTSPAFASRITYLADEVLRRARGVGARLRLLQNGVGPPLWQNTCEHCNGAQEDEALFAAPSGALHAALSYRASQVHVRSMACGFTAAAASVSDTGAFATA